MRSPQLLSSFHIASEPSSSDTLYRDLEDHDIVTKYPAVRGMGSDVFFLNHTNKENGGGDDTVSKHNMFEVRFLEEDDSDWFSPRFQGRDDQRSREVSPPVRHEGDEVKDCSHASRQGCYSDEGDIVVLCAYLGQLMKVRDALKKEMTVVIDERDQAELDRREDEDASGSSLDANIERVQVTQKVCRLLGARLIVFAHVAL